MQGMLSRLGTILLESTVTTDTGEEASHWCESALSVKNDSIKPATLDSSVFMHFRHHCHFHSTNHWKRLFSSEFDGSGKVCFPQGGFVIQTSIYALISFNPSAKTAHLSVCFFSCLGSLDMEPASCRVQTLDAMRLMLWMLNQPSRTLPVQKMSPTIALALFSRPCLIIQRILYNSRLRCRQLTQSGT